MVIGLECLGEQVADQGDHLVVVSIMLGFVKRHVVLVDQQNDFPAIVLVQETAEKF